MLRASSEFFLCSLRRCIHQRSFLCHQVPRGKSPFCSKSSKIPSVVAASDIQDPLGEDGVSKDIPYASTILNESQGKTDDNGYCTKPCDEDYMKPQPRKERIKRALGKLKKGPDGRFINVLEVVSDLDMLIAAYQNLKAQSRPTYLIEDSDDEDSMEGINLERFKKLQKRLLSGTYRFGIVKEPNEKKDFEDLEECSGEGK